MEDVIGGYTDAERFGGFLADWHVRLAERTEQSVAAISAIEGVEGLILAGSIGAGQPWPLSDIDLLPIYDERKQRAAQDAVEATRLALVDRWLEEGWWTGVDIGRLCFTIDELERIFRIPDPDPVPLLTDDRWYHSLDKGFGSRAVHDPHGVAAMLAPWFTAHRFDQAVVAARLQRARREVETNLVLLQRAIATDDLLAGCNALFNAAKWLPLWWLEIWSTRDNSFARVGTRFERLALRHGRSELVATINDVLAQNEPAASARITIAPDWLIERRDRQWAARLVTGEAVTSQENDRDVLRVATQYELRRVTAAPCPAWLGMPETIDDLRVRQARLTSLTHEMVMDVPEVNG